MDAAVALGAFVACIATMSWGSARLTTALERIGVRLRFSDGLLGMVVALGADAPEICSAFAALLSAQHGVGFGVVLGSNIFNLAGLLGLSAVVTGRVRIGRKGLWLNGGISLAVSAVVLALLLQVIAVATSLALLLSLLIPYVALVSLQPPRVARLMLPSAVTTFLSGAIAHAHQDTRKRVDRPPATSRDVIWLAVSLALIVGASFGAVHFAIRLGLRWGIDDTIIGILVLATLTSVPNVAAAIQLAREGRGAAVISEALNSNTFNIIAGISLPALLIGFAPPQPNIIYAAIWLLVMKVVTLLVASQKKGLSRAGGASIIALYLLFASAIIYWE